MQASDGGTGDVRERLRFVAADLHAVAAEYPLAIASAHMTVKPGSDRRREGAGGKASTGNRLSPTGTETTLHATV